MKLNLRAIQQRISSALNLRGWQSQSSRVLLWRRNTSFSCDKQFHFLLIKNIVFPYFFLCLDYRNSFLRANPPEVTFLLLITVTIRLRSRNFYDVIVNEDEAWVNYWPGSDLVGRHFSADPSFFLRANIRCINVS